MKKIKYSILIPKPSAKRLKSKITLHVEKHHWMLNDLLDNSYLYEKDEFYDINSSYIDNLFYFEVSDLYKFGFNPDSWYFLLKLEFSNNTGSRKECFRLDPI